MDVKLSAGIAGRRAELRAVTGQRVSQGVDRPGHR